MYIGIAKSRIVSIIIIIVSGKMKKLESFVMPFIIQKIKIRSIS